MKKEKELISNTWQWDTLSFDEAFRIKVHYLRLFRYKNIPNIKTNNTNRSKIGTKMGTRLFESFSSLSRFSFRGSSGVEVVDDCLGAFVVPMDTWELLGISDILDDVVGVDEAVEKSRNVVITVGKVVLNVGDVVAKTGWDVI